MEHSKPIDVEQLAALWVKAQPTIAAYISSLVPDFHDANDLLQEVGVVVVRKRDEYDSERPFIPWAIRIAQLEILKFRRAAARNRLQFGEQLIERIATTYNRIAPEFDDRRLAIEDCLKKMSGRAALAVRLRYAEGRAIDEIAAQLDTSGSTVRSTLYRVRKALHQCVERYLARLKEA